jgi:tetratricopeptide (TPR) repeat protein
MKIIIAVLVLPLWLLCVAPSPAAEPTVVTAEGKYAMGDLDSKKDARMLALMEAKRIALEKAGTYVESSSEVKNFNLTRDQINTIAAGVMSVEILKEEWKMSGENMVATIAIRARIDTTDLRGRIAAMHDEEENTADAGDIRKQLAALRKELVELKTAQTGRGAKTASSETKEKHDEIIKTMSALDHLDDGNRALEVGQWKQALTAFDAALALNPSLAEAYAGQAMVLQETDRREEAKEKIDQALKLDPRAARNHAIMAVVLRKQGKNEQALASADRAIERQPRNPKFYMLRASIFAGLKKPKAVREDLTRACSLGSAKACERIKQLR